MSWPWIIGIIIYSIIGLGIAAVEVPKDVSSWRGFAYGLFCVVVGPAVIVLMILIGLLFGVFI